MNISDHALVRYIERVKGMSLDQFRHEMLAALDKHEAVDRPVSWDGDGALFVIEYGEDGEATVVTVLVDNQRPKKRKHNRGRAFVHVPRATP